MASTPPVSLTTVVSYWPAHPKWMNEGRAPANRVCGKRPIFKLAEVLKSISVNDIVPGTRDCKDDLADLLWKMQDIWNMLQATLPSHYVNSLWCQVTSCSWIPCDSYVVPNRPTGDEGRLVDIYVKFSVSVTGKVILVVSCHESKE